MLSSSSLGQLQTEIKYDCAVNLEQGRNVCQKIWELAFLNTKCNETWHGLLSVS